MTSQRGTVPGPPTPDLPLGPHGPQPARGGPSRPVQLSGAVLQAGPAPWKASSWAHCRNLIWIPRDQEAPWKVAVTREEPLRPTQAG